MNRDRPTHVFSHSINMHRLVNHGLSPLSVSVTYVGPTGTDHHSGSNEAMTLGRENNIQMGNLRQSVGIVHKVIICSHKSIACGVVRMLSQSHSFMKIPIYPSFARGKPIVNG